MSRSNLALRGHAEWSAGVHRCDARKHGGSAWSEARDVENRDRADRRRRIRLLAEGFSKRNNVHRRRCRPKADGTIASGLSMGEEQTTEIAEVDDYIGSVDADGGANQASRPDALETQVLALGAIQVGEGDDHLYS